MIGLCLSLSVTIKFLKQTVEPENVNREPLGDGTAEGAHRSTTEPALFSERKMPINEKLEGN